MVEGAACMVKGVMAHATLAAAIAYQAQPVTHDRSHLSRTTRFKVEGNDTVRFL
jgi:hypothetical protein